VFGSFNLEATSGTDSKKAEQEEMHVYEVRPRKDKRGVGLVSDALPFGRLWYSEPDAVSNAINCAGGKPLFKLT
jgi:hypothetical protein